MDDKRAPVEINLSALGKGTVYVDGVDLSNYVRAFRFEAAVGEPNRLSIELAAVPVELDAEAETLITKHAPADGGLVDTTTITISDESRRYAASGSWTKPAGTKEVTVKKFGGNGGSGPAPKTIPPKFQGR